jgi:xylem cysteine proteinase
MKGFIAFAVLTTLTLAYLYASNRITISTKDTEFQAYLAEFNKGYITVEEYEMRLKLFKDTLMTIEEHNAKQSSYKMGLNEFSDMTDEEFKQAYTWSGPRTSLVKPTKYEFTGEFPDSIDWRNNNAVTRVDSKGN